jgi:hypothetical protein
MPGVGGNGGDSVSVQVGAEVTLNLTRRQGLFESLPQLCVYIARHVVLPGFNVNTDSGQGGH